MSLIEVKNVEKKYKIYKQKAGVKNVLKNLFCPEISIKTAVSDLSFTIEKGEAVGLIGENGAGKSTTIKMLSGVLFPTAGEITVSGIVPYKNRIENARNICVVFGQRSRLNWDLPMEDSFELYKEIYQIDDKLYNYNKDKFIELLKLDEFYSTPIRQLSLGQRMKVEIAVAMLHSPDILYLDEPTIGLDVLAKRQIRDFIKKRNKEDGTTIILTSHDMKDLDLLCERIIILTKGKKIYDDSLQKFKNDHAKESIIEIVCAEETNAKLEFDNFEVANTGEGSLRVKYNPEKVSLAEVIDSLGKECAIKDFKVQYPDIEDMVRKIYET